MFLSSQETQEEEEEEEEEPKGKKMASPGEEALPADEGYEPGIPLDGPPPGEETDFEDEAHDPDADGHGAPEDIAENEEDDIEVDVVEGESRVARRGTLKRLQTV